MRNANQVTESNAVQGVASGTNLSVDLITSADRVVLEGGEVAVLSPGIGSGVKTISSGIGVNGGQKLNTGGATSNNTSNSESDLAAAQLVIY